MFIIIKLNFLKLRRSKISARLVWVTPTTWATYTQCAVLGVYLNTQWQDIKGSKKCIDWFIHFIIWGNVWVSWPFPIFNLLRNNSTLENINLPEVSLISKHEMWNLEVSPKLWNKRLTMCTYIFYYYKFNSNNTHNK